jgi:hypothetical protein
MRMEAWREESGGRSRLADALHGFSKGLSRVSTKLRAVAGFQLGKAVQVIGVDGFDRVRKKPGFWAKTVGDIPQRLKPR